MNALADRLRLLRRDAGLRAATPAVRPAAASTSAVPGATHAELRRLLQLRAYHAQPPAPATASDRIVPGKELAPGLRYQEHFADVAPPSSMIDAGFARIDAAVARRRLLHFDTETTGLAGGTGTRAFMIGAADWQAGRLRVRQLTLTTLAAEADMLRAFAAWLDAGTVLVSYNGKSYDAPLLATRYRLARLPNPLAGLPHLDLLHPVRRRWKQAWPNCRLVTAERELLGVMRDDDLPGAQAPAAWLRYLRGGSSADLRRVLTHNAQDLASLAGLLAVLERAAATEAIA